MKAVKEKVYKRAYLSKEKFRAIKMLKQNSFEFVAHRYHCSIRTLYRWLKIFDGTLESLQNKFCPPHTPHPKRHTEQELTSIQNLIRRNPDIGLNELYGKLRLNYGYSRHPVSLYRLLRKRGWYLFGKPKRKMYKPQPYDTPIRLGEKWQLDVKYVPRACYVGEYKWEKMFFQYTVVDEASRERFIFPYEEQNADSTIDFVKRAIKYFGYKPKEIQTDNGIEFTYTIETAKDKEHSFDRFCRLTGISHKLIKPRTPRHNGKVERSHRNDNERFYKFLKFFSFADLLRQMSAYLKRSNNIPISCLATYDKKQKWLTPIQKRQELLSLNFCATV